MSLDTLINVLNIKVSYSKLHLLARSYIYIYIRTIIASPVITKDGESHMSVFSNIIWNSLAQHGVPSVTYQSNPDVWLWVGSNNPTHTHTPTSTLHPHPPIDMPTGLTIYNHFIKLLQYMCMSRCKLLSRMEQNCFPYWGNTGAHIADSIDKGIFRTFLNNNMEKEEEEKEDSTDRKAQEMNKQPTKYFALWMGSQVTSFMDIYMSLQLEHKLVQGNELDYYYFYWDYIMNIKVYVMEQIKQCAYQADVDRYMLSRQVYEEQLLLHQSSLQGSKKKSSSKNGKNSNSIDNATLPLPPLPLPTAPVIPKQPVTTVNDLIIKVKAQLFRAYVRILLAGVGLDINTVIKRQNIYTTWELKYMQRFKAFQVCMNAGFVPYNEYLNGISKYGSVTDIRLLLENANICLSNIKLYNDAKKVISVPGVTPSPALPTAWVQVIRSLEDDQFTILYKIAISSIIQLKPILTSITNNNTTGGGGDYKPVTSSTNTTGGGGDYKPVTSSTITITITKSVLFMDYKYSPYYPIISIL